ncbi:MAG: class I tRNA ligase family protein, partial [Armatimonadaceae bacterium]
MGATDILQSEDVLDTWFSSALWPFATLGWPEQTESLRYWYPTSLLSTAQEILYLWVARMVMTGEYFMDERPFDDVYIHATILDEHGRRMSKSKGNGIDPVDLIDLYGADALRFALVREAGQRQDIRIRPIRDGRQEQVEQARNFCNKIWNASRFVLMNLGDHPAPTCAPKPVERVDRWIVSRLGQTIRDVNAALDAYAMDDAARAVYTFVWDDLCDWYIEAAKPRLQAGDTAVKDLLWVLLERTLRVLHPILPHLTETIWQNLPGAKSAAGVEHLMFASFPDPEEFPADAAADREWAWVQEVTGALRALLSENNVRKGGDAVVQPNSESVAAVLQQDAALVAALAKVSLRFGAPDGEG